VRTVILLGEVAEERITWRSSPRGSRAGRLRANVVVDLVSAGVLSETERTDRAAIQRAVTEVLNALPPPAMAPQPVVSPTLAELNVARLVAARKIRMGIATP
jgi:hypothetical protein